MYSYLDSSDIHDSVTHSSGNFPWSGDRNPVTCLDWSRVTHRRIDSLGRGTDHRCVSYKRSHVSCVCVVVVPRLSLSFSISLWFRLGLCMGMSLGMMGMDRKSMCMRDGLGNSCLHQAGGFIHYLRALGGGLRYLSTLGGDHLLTVLCDYCVFIQVKHCLAHLEEE